jgi:hypothetical protein
MTTADVSALVGMGISDFLVSMGPASAGAALLSRCLQFNFDGTGVIMVPSLLSAATNTSFVVEGAPIPVRKFAISGTTLTPKKMACISTYTRETLNHSLPNVELLVRQELVASVALTLDSVLFDTSAGDASRLPDLRYNIAALSQSASADHAMACRDDLHALLAAVSAIAGANEKVFIAAPAQADAIGLNTNFLFPHLVLPCGALTDGTVIAVATNALCSVVDPAPRFESSIEAVLHYEDTTPLDITTRAVATTVKSVFQSDLIGLRMIMEVSWALRNAGGLAWVGSTVW